MLIRWIQHSVEDTLWDVNAVQGKEAILYFFKKEMDLAPQYGYCLTTTMPMVGELRIRGENRRPVLKPTAPHSLEANWRNPIDGNFVQTSLSSPGKSVLLQVFVLRSSFCPLE